MNPINNTNIEHELFQIFSLHLTNTLTFDEMLFILKNRLSGLAAKVAEEKVKLGLMTAVEEFAGIDDDDDGGNDQQKSPSLSTTPNNDQHRLPSPPDPTPAATEFDAAERFINMIVLGMISTITNDDTATMIQ